MLGLKFLPFTFIYTSLSPLQCKNIFLADLALFSSPPPPYMINEIGKVLRQFVLVAHVFYPIKLSPVIYFVCMLDFAVRTCLVGAGSADQRQIQY